jgi:hypothetical protein
MDDDAQREERERVDISSDSGVRYWAKTLHVHPEDLRAAVQTVGTRVDDVRRYLKRQN